MAKPVQRQQLHPDSVEQSLMADLYFGTPIGLDNNSGEYNIAQQTEGTTVSQVEENSVE
ncbi:MAG TPA: hypothetical protein VJ824_01195 [Bacillota bacterium]|nr:hypothetical protein [Bacillota bacterium]